MRTRFHVFEIEHGADVDASLEDLRQAGCWQIEVLGVDYACECMRVECELPEGVTHPDQLALKVACL